ncbi:MAG: methyltransferase domain-containing protein [Anaerolineales bacterium]|jgi:ubiquinone/menaquinone biosynthesis C-methylase UbiE
MEDKAIIIEAFTEMAPRYEQLVDSELNRFWGWSYSGFVNLLLASAPIQPQDIILDVATGTGMIPALLEKAGHPRNQIHALDITMSMLFHARQRLGAQDGSDIQHLVCASAMQMPYADSSFTQVICGLATHHMNVNQLAQESIRILQNGGKLTIADVGGANILKFPGVKFIVRIALFIYFMLVENKSRAWAESRAITNVQTKEDWTLILMNSGFRNIVIQKLKSRYFWVPSPLLIKAEKQGGRQDG